MADPTPPATPFAIKVDNKLFLDAHNKFHATAPAGAKVYEIGGGLLSLSTNVQGQLLSGTLAVLPLKNEPSWVGKLRKIGVDEEVLSFFGSAASIAGNIVSIIGWAQAAMQILEMLGIFKTKPSLEDMVRQILAKLNLVQDMVAETQESGVRLAIDTDRGFIEAMRDACAFRGKTLNEAPTRALYDKNERKAMRQEMIAEVEEADGYLRGLLSPSRWRFLCQSKHYRGLWAFYTDPEEVTLTNPPWWGSPRHVPRQRLADDGLTWVDATYPAAYKARFDYRAALPHAVQCGFSLIGMLQITEPEFRTTGWMRGPLLDWADLVEDLMREMRRTLVRSKHTADQFLYIDPSSVVMKRVSGSGSGAGIPFLGGDDLVPVLKRPLSYWQVGALDLCAHNDSYFNNLAAALPASPWPAPPPSYKLGTVDFDWIPPSYELRWVEPPFPGPYTGHWEMANANECAAAAERQSEEDFVTILQASGYFQLAQLHAMLKHLATDPERSETVDGYARSARRQIATRDVPVVGYDGLFCDPVTTTGTLKEFGCETTISLTTQEPDRVHKIPTRFLLVALTSPAGSGYEVVQSEVELVPNSGPTPVTLSAVSTFDFLVEKVLVGGTLWTPVMSQLQQMQMRVLSLPGPPSIRGRLDLAPDYYTVANGLPAGDIRNKRLEAITVDCEFSAIDTDTRRGAWIKVASRQGQRNADHVYIATEETLSSGEPLRTYFEVDLYTQLTYVPASFFRREQECLERTERLVDEIDRRYAESAPRLPPHVPITAAVLQNRVAQARAGAPDLVATVLANADKRRD